MYITKNYISMLRWDDGHLHLRSGNMLKTVLPYSEGFCEHALVIANSPKARTGGEVGAYMSEICNAQMTNTFKPHIAFYITNATTYEMAKGAKDSGAIAGKLFIENPIGGETTTGS